MYTAPVSSLTTVQWNSQHKNERHSLSARSSSMGCSQILMNRLVVLCFGCGESRVYRNSQLTRRVEVVAVDGRRLMHVKIFAQEDRET